MNAVQRFCDRPLCERKGACVELGEPRAGADVKSSITSAPEEERGEVPRTSEAALRRDQRDWFEDEHGSRTALISTGRGCDMGMRVRGSAMAVEDPVFGAVSRRNAMRRVRLPRRFSESRSGNL
jgi:hypothetical protein